MKKLALLVTACALLTACTTMHRNVVNQIDATNVDFMSMRKGTDCKYLLLGLIPFSNQDIDAAAKSAKIRKLRYVEHSTSYYFLFSKQCVVVYGQ